jgi:hypothetical protein
MPARTYARLDCPKCHGPLTRVRRLAPEKSAQDMGELRRYSCAAQGCEWQGLLPRRVRQPRQLLLRRVVRKVQRRLLPAAVLASLGVTMAAFAWQAGMFAPGAQRGWAAGEHHDGELLPTAHALSRHHARAQRQQVALKAATATASAASSASALAGSPGMLQLRYGCVWGKPGRNPYRGDVEQALRSAALPEEVVKSIAAQVRAGKPVDKLEIRNDGVQALGTGRVFSAQNIAMTYGQTLCLGTRVNFKAGHTEPAALYEAATVDGRVVAVMVPEVCGNVSVLGQSDDSVRAMRAAGGVNASEDTAAARWMPAVLEGTGGALVAGAVSDIPEPATLALVVGALLLLAGARWLRGRKVIKA